MGDIKIRWSMVIDVGTADAIRIDDIVTATDRANPELLRRMAKLIGLQVQETIERELLGEHLDR